jgi:hypothetical protein
LIVDVQLRRPLGLCRQCNCQPAHPDYRDAFPHRECIVALIDKEGAGGLNVIKGDPETLFASCAAGAFDLNAPVARDRRLKVKNVFEGPEAFLPDPLVPAP